ncbi:MAG: NADH-quinone oxidoreductase subunit M [Candidatus Marsarchaeota archaeon]|nr:NADH-quinone oxidoreductase subunit M [Candidatus Marsarchaeota archaeon]
MILPILPLLVLIPFLSIIPILLLEKRGIRATQIIVSSAVLALSIALVYAMRIGLSTGFSYSYIPLLGVDFGLQVNAISLILVLMSSIVFFAASLVFDSFIRDNERTYGVLFALVQGSSMALFLSSNLLVLYLFWEIAEFSMFFIILLFGSLNRRYAAIKFIVYSIISSMALFLGFIVLYFGVTPHTFSIQGVISGAASMPLPMQLYALVLLFVAFAIKTPVFPFHTWLPDAHTEAPTTGSMVLAGVLLKFGGYGFILAVTMIPLAAKYAVFMAALFILSAVYSALVSMRQHNLKRMIAYTSITEMSIVVFAVVAHAAGSAQALNGALYAMLAHGIAVSLMFLMAGAIFEAYGTLEISALKGVIRHFRPLAWLFIFGTFAMVGLPLTAGFIGDLLVFIGAYAVFGIVALLPLAAILLLAGILFWIVERVFMSGRATWPTEQVPMAIYYTGTFLAVSTIVLGVLPFLLVH